MMKGKHEKKRNKNFLLVLSRSKKKNNLCGKLALFPCIFLNKKEIMSQNLLKK